MSVHRWWCKPVILQPLISVAQCLKYHLIKIREFQARKMVSKKFYTCATVLKI